VQQGFDQRPLSLESFMEVIGTNSMVRDAFGYHWLDGECKHPTLSQRACILVTISDQKSDRKFCEELVKFRVLGF
jgi:hypothetical protein